MAYDVDLAARLREALAAEPDVLEKSMFGGLAFLVGGHMTVAAGGRGLMLRVDPARAEALLADPRASRMVMRGREMAGWLRVDVDLDAPDDDLDRWVGEGLAFVRTLPAR
ncbi:TfoX/Sxy family protein [Pseudonocardia lacus]|uniref:TfoX/Sxy family protein n=1 Tax=Pseudonocardia lacus TaxID=2835865 RepID=UPI001BDD8C4D|nr:TfoX/Sxy family protein [Pseudonocardia lacus]